MCRNFDLQTEDCEHYTVYFQEDIEIHTLYCSCFERHIAVSFHPNGDEYYFYAVKKKTPFQSLTGNIVKSREKARDNYTRR